MTTATLTAMVDRQDTPTLLASLALLAQPTEHAHRMVRAAILEVLEARHNLTEALDEWAMDTDSSITYDAKVFELIAAKGVRA